MEGLLSVSTLQIVIIICAGLTSFRPLRVLGYKRNLGRRSADFVAPTANLSSEDGSKSASEGWRALTIAAFWTLGAALILSTMPRPKMLLSWPMAAALALLVLSDLSGGHFLFPQVRRTEQL